MFYHLGKLTASGFKKAKQKITAIHSNWRSQSNPQLNAALLPSTASDTEMRIIDSESTSPIAAAPQSQELTVDSRAHEEKENAILTSFKSLVASAKSTYGTGVILRTIALLLTDQKTFDDSIATPATLALLASLTIESSAGIARGLSQHKKIEHTTPLAEAVLEPIMAVLLLAVEIGNPSFIIASLFLAPLWAMLNAIDPDTGMRKDKVTLHKPAVCLQNNHNSPKAGTATRICFRAIHLLNAGLMTYTSTSGYINFLLGYPLVARVYGIIRALNTMTCKISEKNGIDNRDLESRFYRYTQKITALESGELNYYENFIVLSWAISLLTGNISSSQNTQDTIIAILVAIGALPAGIVSFFDARKILEEQKAELLTTHPELADDIESVELAKTEKQSWAQSILGFFSHAPDYHANMLHSNHDMLSSGLSVNNPK